MFLDGKAENENRTDDNENKKRNAYACARWTTSDADVIDGEHDSSVLQDHIFPRVLILLTLKVQIAHKLTAEVIYSKFHNLNNVVPYHTHRRD